MGERIIPRKRWFKDQLQTDEAWMIKSDWFCTLALSLQNESHFKRKQSSRGGIYFAGTAENTQGVKNKQLLQSGTLVSTGAPPEGARQAETGPPGGESVPPAPRPLRPPRSLLVTHVLFLPCVSRRPGALSPPRGQELGARKSLM